MFIVNVVLTQNCLFYYRKAVLNDNNMHILTLYSILYQQIQRSSIINGMVLKGRISQSLFPFHKSVIICLVKGRAKVTLTITIIVMI